MLLEQLSNAFGPSGNEDEVRRILARALRDRVDELKTDALGNLIAFKRGSGAEPRLRVMVDAHTDEVGLMITRIEKNGLLGFRIVGGIDDRLLMAKGVVIGEKRLPGVILAPPVHLTKKDQRKQVIKVEQLAIDVGATSDDEAKEMVRIGDYGTFDTRFQALDSPQLRTVKGKAFDDRAGCAVAAALAEEKYEVDLYLSFSAQEEVGLRGARVAAFRLQPDLAFALEGTVCDDTPKEQDISPTTRLGGGPAISLMDRSFIADRRLVELLTSTARAQGIPYQFKQPGVGSTDAGAIHLAGAGVPSVAVSVPCRYIHGPVSMLSLQDFDHLVALMKASLKALPAAWQG
ncbi:MAG: M42 family metallopeptidase [Anaerolineaceae bacterium]|nr:M42 family metallopeptidase [Anaerolineaceae bacterium]